MNLIADVPIEDLETSVYDVLDITGIVVLDPVPASAVAVILGVEPAGSMTFAYGLVGAERATLVFAGESLDREALLAERPGHWMRGVFEDEL